MASGQVLKWTGQFPEVAPIAGATDTPIGIAATKTNVYVAGDVLLTHGRFVGVAQYEVPELPGGEAKLKSSVYFSNSASAPTEPIIADKMVISTFAGTHHPEWTEGTRVFVASHSPDVFGRQRTLVTTYITSDEDDPALPREKYGKITLSWTRYLEDMNDASGDQIPVAIAVDPSTNNELVFPAVAVAIKAYNFNTGWNMRLVVLRVIDGKMALDQTYSSEGLCDDIPVGVAIGQGQAFIGGTTWNVGLDGPRMLAAGWNYMTGSSLSGSPVVVAHAPVQNAVATCMSGSPRPTETRPISIGPLFAMGGHSVPPVAGLILNQDIVTATFKYNTFTEQMELVGANAWGQVDPVSGAPTSEDSAVAIAFAEEFTENPLPPQGPVIGITGTSRKDGEPTKIVTVQFPARGFDQVRQWWALYDPPVTFGDAFPTSIQYDADDSSADGFYHTYVSGAILGPSGNLEFINLKYVAKCSLTWTCNPTDGPRAMDPSWASGAPIWPVSPFTNGGNDIAVSTSARNVLVSPSVNRRWFFTTGPSYRGLFGINWETLGYCEEGCTP